MTVDGERGLVLRVIGRPRRSSVSRPRWSTGGRPIDKAVGICWHLEYTNPGCAYHGDHLGHWDNGEFDRSYRVGVSHGLSMRAVAICNAPYLRTLLSSAKRTGCRDRVVPCLYSHLSSHIPRYWDPGMDTNYAVCGLVDICNRTQDLEPRPRSEYVEYRD